MSVTVVPTVPAFATNDSSLTSIEDLAYCLRFLVGDIRPAWHAFTINARTVASANTWTTINFGTIAYDSEANVPGSTGIMASASTAQIQTQGIYAVESCATAVATSSAFYFDLSFLMTGGGNNPNLSTGSTRRFGLRGNTTLATAATQVTVCCADTTPVCAYPLDTIAMQVRASAASVVVQTNMSPVPAYNQGRFVTNFSGHWIRVGS